MSKKRKKKHTGRNIFLIVLLLLVVGICIFWNPIKEKLMEKTAAVVVEKLLEEKMKSDPAAYGNAAEIYDSMSAADKQTLNEIIGNNMTEENISNVRQFVASGDMSGLKEYVKSSLSAEEQNEIQQMYEKYKSQFQ